MEGNSENYIQLDTGKLYYRKWGTGSKVLIALHGYNNDALLFDVFRPYLSEKYTILAFDLPHHGQSTWAVDILFTRENLINLINTVIQKYSVQKVSLMGYSMGGRICLTVIEMMPGIVDKVLLMAPDGLVAEPFYYFLTHTWLGRRVFRSVLTAPRIFFSITDWLHKKRFTDSARHKFVNHYLGSRQSRMFLLRVWPAFKDIVPDRKKLKAMIRQFHIPVTIFMGIHDHIIPPRNGEAFIKGLDFAKLIILPKGHRVFDSENAGEIAKILLQ